jgi:hypothetical protein
MVTETIEANREAFIATPKRPAATSFARIHIYQPDTLREIPTYIERYSGLVLDRKRLGGLSDDEYACVAVHPGPHILNLKHSACALTAEPGREYYFRITYRSPGSSDGTMEETEGYQFENTVLRPGSFGLKGLSCFPPPENGYQKNKYGWSEFWHDAFIPQR